MPHHRTQKMMLIVSALCMTLLALPAVPADVAAPIPDPDGKAKPLRVGYGFGNGELTDRVGLRRSGRSSLGGHGSADRQRDAIGSLVFCCHCPN